MFKKILPLALILGAIACKTSQKTEVAPALKEKITETTTTQSIPNDPSVKKGVLSNGLTYYIQNNGKPADKVELRLVINAGSILEDDDQQGLAHFMEHMCFNGTKNFKKNELVDYLQSIGVKFGAHLNAYTGFDKTVYILPIPSDDAEKLEKGFQILEDWAFNALLTDEEINNERGVIMEEYRTGLGANKRMMKNYLPKIMYKSKYADRLPIGKKEIIENFKPEAIRRFYKDWYRPDLMAVIAVGDVDVAMLEDKIKAHFEKQPKAENPRKRESFHITNHDETFVAIESDKEATFNQVQLMYMADGNNPTPEKTINDARNSLVESLFATMINNRLGELRNSKKPPFVYGFSSYGGTFARSKEAYQSMAMAAGPNHLTALKALAEENERVKRYGFQNGEFNRAKTSILARYEKAFLNQGKTESRRLVQPLIDNFLTGESYQNDEWAYHFSQQQLPTISLAEVNVLIKKYLKETNRMIILTGKEKTTTEKEVLDLLESVKTNTSIKPYEDATIQESLFTTLPKKGTIVKETSNEKLGIKTITLSNGAKVTYKKTDFKNDEILFDTQSYGGTSLLNNKDFISTHLAINAITEGGIAGLNKNDLKKFLTGKMVSLRPRVSNSYEGMNGSSTPKDLETLFQLIHLNFTSVNKDPESFQSHVIKQKGFLGNLLANPNYYFMDAFGKFKNPNNPRHTGFPTPEAYDNTNYELAYKIYNERFANAADFDFYFVGNFDENKLKEFTKQYIASLPANDKKENFKDLGYRQISGNHTKIFNKGNDPKSKVSIIYRGEASYNDKDALAIKTIGEILSIKMIEKLREEAQGVYSPRVGARMNKDIYDTYSLNISFGCGPENAEKLKTIAMQEVTNLINNGPSEKDLNKAKEGYLVARKEQLMKNKFWLSRITEADFNKTDINNILNFEKSVNSMTTKQIQNAAKKYFSNGAIIGMLMPEKQ